MNNENSAIKVTPDLQQELADAKQTHELAAILHRHAISQGVVTPDPFDKDAPDWSTMRPVEPGTAPRGFAKTVVINNVKHIIEGATEAELVSNELALMRSIFAEGTTTEATTEEQPRNERGQFITHDPTATALAPSVAAALEAQGIDVDELRQFTAAKRGEKYEQNWASAVPEFIAAHPDWQGGDENRKVISDIIVEQGWENENPADALESAYKIAVEQGRLGSNPALDIERKVAEATTPEELRAAIGYRSRENSSSFWGR